MFPMKESHRKPDHVDPEESCDRGFSLRRLPKITLLAKRIEIELDISFMNLTYL